MKKLLFATLLFVTMGTLVNAQDYKTGVGLRLGWDQGLTIKHFIGSKPALEGILSARYRGFDVTGLFEVHNRAFDVDRLDWYFGGGAHVGFYGTNYGYGSGTFVGLTGILGLEYNFAEVPINLSLDWKPVFDFGYSHFIADGGALSIRYIF
jgi:hypothetical protein